MLLLGLALTIFWLTHPAEADSNCTTLSLAGEMGTGGGWMMFSIGLIGGVLLLLGAWYVIKRRQEANAAPPPAQRVIPTPISLFGRGGYERVASGFI